MLGLVVMIRRFVAAARTAWRDGTFRGAVSGILILLVSATIFYTLAEGWPVLDAVYFSIVTGLTIGYGDLVPTGPVSKIFTVLYALLSVGLYVLVAASLASALTKDAADRRARRKHRRSED
ncbi:potassium channel family protein [Myceligenerans pegani]|uniref:Two pore domain potassium channel family protein n=1 Tax=Myceligenerans pegani TaxID=2776917 RepID=A0ABR9MXC9_9MICO|nr:potassium channel family protein [Myceligenerans sp. TRM 65318]MBE1876046.1 two pore domain potassium channel family protein [Myceligenerans sp. TRM 65318]MBE3018317.1 two pore domain potassium channel family protein [Myceligenerans sp. TRM 65318]